MSQAIDRSRLLTSKTRVPPARLRHIPRPRLFSRLDMAVERPITIVSAPAGFGKSTLLSTWIAGSDSARLAWLSLDQDDSDPARFISYLIAALEAVVPGVGKGANSLLGSLQPLPARELMTILLNELESLIEPIIVVLDDYHVVSNTDLDAVMVHAVEHLPPCVRLILCTRQQPSFPFATWRAREQVAEIEAADLRFSEDESELFLRETMQLSLDLSTSNTLAERTEGWIAGLQLAALSLQAQMRTRGSAGIRTYLDRFNGSHRFIEEFISEIVSQQSDATRDFLSATAILDRLCPSLCDAVMAARDSEAMLEWLERNNLFVTRLDEDGKWYRYHQLFLDYLRAHDASDGRERHRRAKDWYEQQGFGWEAVNHAIAAHDHTEAVRLLRDNVNDLCCRGEFSTVLKAIDRLPEQVVVENGDISGFKAWILYLQGAVKQSEAYTKLVLGAHSKETPHEVRGTLLAFQAFLGINRGNAKQAVAHAEEALTYFGSSDSFFRCCALTLLGYAHRQQGNQVLSSEVFRQAMDLGLEHNNVLMALDAISGLTMLMLGEGQLREALHLCDMAIARFKDGTGQPLPACGLAHISRGMLRYEANDLKAAEDDLRLGISLCQHIGMPNFVLMGNRMLARVLFDAGDRDAAWSAVAQAKQLAGKNENPRRMQRVEAIAADLNLREGNLTAAERSIRAASDLSKPASQYERLVYVRTCIARGRLERAEEILDMMERDAARTSRSGHLITIFIQQALVRRARGDRTGAIDRVESAVSLAAPENYRRVFINEGPPLLELLKELRGTAPQFVASLIADMAGSSETGRAADATATATATAQLSSTQQRIMSLLSEGKTNQEIASTLQITVGTTKWHLNQIFGKLDVRNRTEAVALARRTGLLT